MYSFTDLKSVLAMAHYQFAIGDRRLQTAEQRDFENLKCRSFGHRMPRMKILTLLLVLPVSVFAQQGGGRGAAPANPPKNLKLLAPNTEIRFVMQSFSEALGVQCTYCHVQGDFAADTNPKKEIARKMIAMVRLIDTSFPSSAGGLPDGYY